MTRNSQTTYGKPLKAFSDKHLVSEALQWYIELTFYLLFILKAQVLRCWGIAIRFLDGKETGTDVIVLYLLFLHFEFWDCKQNSVPDVWEVIFPNISIEGGIDHPNVHGLFDHPSQAVLLPAYNLEVLHWCFIATTILMSQNWTSTKRTSGERFREHFKAPSLNFGHQNSSGHETSKL